MMTTEVEDIGARLSAGGVLSPDEARVLWSSPDVLAVGALADEARRRRHGDRATFVRVVTVAADGPLPGTWPAAAGEVRIVGRPADAAHAERLVRDVVARAGGTPVTAFSLADLEEVAGAVGLRDLVARVAGAGAAAIAALPVDRLADAPSSAEAVLQAGTKVARVTVEAAGDPVGHALAVRALQRQTGVVRAFAPLAVRVASTAPTTGYQDVKTIAVARLLLDDVGTIQVDWARSGAKLAQVALLFGADDLDGVPASENAAEGRRRAPLEEVRRNIRAAALTPIERDGRFGVREG
jgi:aminodeoxyfutalosine synthase